MFEFTRVVEQTDDETELVFGQISAELRCAEGEYEFQEGMSEPPPALAGMVKESISR